MESNVLASGWLWIFEAHAFAIVRLSAFVSAGRVGTEAIVRLRTVPFGLVGDAGVETDVFPVGVGAASAADGDFGRAPGYVEEEGLGRADLAISTDLVAVGWAEGGTGVGCIGRAGVLAVDCTNLGDTPLLGEV